MPAVPLICFSTPSIDATVNREVIRYLEGASPPQQAASHIMGCQPASAQGSREDIFDWLACLTRRPVGLHATRLHHTVHAGEEFHTGHDHPTSKTERGLFSTG